MDDLRIERQFPYRRSLMACAFTFTLFGAGTLGCLYLAVTDNRAILLQGVIRLEGMAAACFRWSLFLLTVSGLILSGVSLWNRIVSPSQRIGLTSKGILMPRKVWGLSIKEKYVRFTEITVFAFQEDLDDFGRSHITGLRFSSPQGEFSVAAAKLAPEAFQEIQRYLLVKVAPEVSRQAAALLLPTTANRLEISGEWDRALTLYQEAAERLRGHQDGTYAENCILRIQQKQACAEGNKPA
jgi:hypothetical protein